MRIDIRAAMATDPTAKATSRIQAAIDEAASSGGGEVLLRSGEYRCGPIQLKSRVQLTLEQGAKVVGHWTPASAAMPALIWAAQEQYIQIAGDGLIDACGSEATFPRGTRPRPHGIEFRDCRDVAVAGISFRNSPSWGICFRQCHDVDIVQVKVDNHNNYNNDGIDIADCHGVRITHCDVSSDDDAICLKSFEDQGNEDIEIAHCRVASHCNAIKTGTESYGAFRNIRIHDCEVLATRSARVYFGKPSGQSAICLTNVDGADVSDIKVSDVAIRSGTDIPFCLRLGARQRRYHHEAARPVGRFRRVVLERIRSENVLNSSYGCVVAGVVVDGGTHYIEDVVLRDVDLHFVGDVEDTKIRVPENAEAYPHPYVLGSLPSYGLYCRHVRGLRLEQVRLTKLGRDARPPILFEDVHNVETPGSDVEP